MKIKLDTEKFRYIGLFETLTNAATKDCLINSDKIIFIVNEGEAKKAIGKKGIVVKRISALLNKNIEVIEFSKDPIKFVRNIFYPIRIDAYIAKKADGKRVLHIIPKERHPLTREKLKKSKMLISQYFNIDVVLG